MKHKRILTRKNGICLNALWEDDVLVQLDASDFTTAALIGSIYIGRVGNIVENMGAVFVEYRRGQEAYLERRIAPEVRIGDTLLVQITRETIGNKPPRCTTKLTLSSHYVVLVQGSGMVAVSSKIHNKERRKQLKAAFSPYVTPEYGFILRTNSAQAKDEEILREIRELEEQYRQIRKGIYQAPFARLYTPPVPYLTEIRDYDLAFDTEIITDQEDVYAQLQETFANAPQTLQLRFYEDSRLSLYRLYSLEGQIGEVLRERVWLKSGAYLVIQRTEAMVVIDVNSGRAVAGRRENERTFLQVNLEAAAEAARQLRLRNLSGIIVIDFIDLSDEAAEKKLLNTLREKISHDPVFTDLVEMTRLKFAVLTREKVRSPFAEQLRTKQLNEKYKNH